MWEAKPGSSQVTGTPLDDHPPCASQRATLSILRNSCPFSYPTLLHHSSRRLSTYHASQRSHRVECSGTSAVCSLPVPCLPQNSPTLPPIWIKISLPGHRNTQCPERTGTGNQWISLNYIAAKVNRLQAPLAVHWTGSRGNTGYREALAVAFPALDTFLSLVWRTVSHFHCQQVLLLTTTILLPQVLPGSSQDTGTNETWRLCVKLSAYLQPSKPSRGSVSCPESLTRFH